MKRETIINLIVITLLSFSLAVQAQTNSFEQGIKAYNEGKKHEALRLLQKAVLHEKYEMKGKDIPVAYAYMAMIRNEYLEKYLSSDNLKGIAENPGLMRTAIADINSAVEYHDNSAKGMIQKVSKRLTKNATKLGKLVTDSLLKMDYESKSAEVREVAAILNYQLKDLSSIENDNWKLHDMLGFTHFLMDEMDMAMLEFKRGRDIYNEEGSQELYELHLRNCLYSAKYHYKESKNYLEAQLATEDGKKYLELMMNSASDDLAQLRELSAMDGVFSSIQSRIENVSTISSTKE